MQWLLEMVVGLVAVLLSAALSQFGLDTQPPDRPNREVHRVRDCDDPPVGVLLAAAEKRERDC